MGRQPRSHARLEALYKVASNQAGYFTTSQAKAAGYGWQHLTYYVRTGRFERVRPGLYRLTLFPSSPHEDLFRAVLEVGPRAVVSHDSALALYDLSDVLPKEIHLIVPPNTSRRHRGLRLHLNRLAEDEVTRYEGLPVTTVSRTIADVAMHHSDDLVIQAVQEALQRGLLTKESLLADAYRYGKRVQRLLEQALQEETNIEVPKWVSLPTGS